MEGWFRYVESAVYDSTNGLISSNAFDRNFVNYEVGCFQIGGALLANFDRWNMAFLMTEQP
jgi:hypothetical protein